MIDGLVKYHYSRALQLPQVFIITYLYSTLTQKLPTGHKYIVGPNMVADGNEIAANMKKFFELVLAYQLSLDAFFIFAGQSVLLWVFETFNRAVVQLPVTS